MPDPDDAAASQPTEKMSSGRSAWLKVLAIGIGVVAVVGAVALLAQVVAPVGVAIREGPVVVAVLVVGTVLVLALAIRAAAGRDR